MRSSDNTWRKSAVPAFTWLRSYHHDWFRLDLIAGITLAAYLLPAALGDASLANLPPETGLYACLFGYRPLHDDRGCDRPLPKRQQRCLFTA